MSEYPITISQAIQNSQSALKRGEKLAARRWAEKAITLAPEREEPWLLMAALAHPLASVGYLNQALKINPQSSRANAGMQWALKRVDEYQKAALTAPQLNFSPAVTEQAPQDEKGFKPQSDSQPPAPPLYPSDQNAKTSPLKVAKNQPLVTSSQTPKGVLSNKTYLYILLPLVCLAIMLFAVWSAIPLAGYFSRAISIRPSTPTSIVENSPALNQSIPETAEKSELIITSTGTATPEPSQTALPTETPPATATIEPTPTALPTDTGPQAYTSSQTSSNSNSQNITPYSGSKRIVVSISEQHMYVYEGDNLVFSFIISTGIGGSTRPGTFSVLDKIPNAYGATWNLWMPNWMGIYYAGALENGIHALPILSNGSTLWEGYLGAPVSYGCVVLSTYDSQLLYDWAEIGVPVIIER
jgi:lipoprotein-anchoring transpeptidase ErfK/SrfK